MNRVTEAYLAACARPGSELATAGARLVFEPHFANTWGARQLARPLFAPEPHLRRAADDIHALCRLMWQLPQRLFDGDVARLCRELEMDERAAALACESAARHATPLYARPDLYYDGARFTLLETNAGTECGGVDAAAINEAYLALPEFTAFARGHGLGYVDTGEHIAGYLRDLAEPITGGGREPVVALVDISSNMAAWHEYYLAFAAHMADRGIELKISHIADLGSAGGKLTAGGTPVDVVIRYFTIEEICADRRAEEWLTPVLRAHEDGTTFLIASLDHGIYANKGVLAMVSELRERGELASEEAAMVDRILPWTRRVTPELWRQCQAGREHLLLKPSVGGGGRGVTCGWAVTDAEWEVAFKDALLTPYVVQERAGVLLEPVLDGDVASEWLPVYGMFVFEQGYAGSFIRTHPAAGRTVVNASTGATFTSVFSFPGE